MRRLREAIRQKLTELWKNQSWILHYNNAPAYTLMLVRLFVFIGLGGLKIAIKGKHFATIEEVKEKSKQELLAIPKRFVSEVFRGLEKKTLPKCIISDHTSYTPQNSSFLSGIYGFDCLLLAFLLPSLAANCLPK